MSTLALVGLGSNLGDRKATLDAAVAALAGTPGVELRAVSLYHQTRPVGGPGGQGAFLNGAAAAETTLAPLDFLRTLREIETRSGRVRAARWGERTLDLDLLLFGDQVIDTRRSVNNARGSRSPHLRVPHPRMAFRRFVLAPLAEIAPGVIDPLTGRTVADLLANLDRRPSYVAIHHAPSLFADPARVGPSLFQRIVAELGGLGLPTSAEPPALRPDEQATRLAEAFDAALWTPDHLGDRWLVSDFWFDGLIMDTLHDPTDPVPADFHLLWPRARSQIPTPTFVVVDQESLADSYRAGRYPDRSRRSPPLGETPIFTPESADPAAAAAEILAACAAARSN